MSLAMTVAVRFVSGMRRDISPKKSPSLSAIKNGYSIEIIKKYLKIFFSFSFRSLE